MGEAGREVGGSLPLPPGERPAAQWPGEGAFAPKPTPRTKQFARALRADPTDAEYLLWYELRNRVLNGYRFSRQVRIGSFICDFVCRSEKLIVELDGSQHAENPVDERRTQWLLAQGYSVLRFWNDEMACERGAVLETILAALEGRLDPVSTPSPHLRFFVPPSPSPGRFATDLSPAGRGKPRTVE